MKKLFLGLVVVSLAASFAAAATTVYVEKLDNSWTAPGGGGVYSAYYGPPDYDDVLPGATAVYLGRQAGIIKAGITPDPTDGHYWDQGLFGFKPNVTIDALAASTLTYDVANQTGANPVWMTIVIDVAGTGNPNDPSNPAYQFVPATNPAGWHTVDAGAGQWQLMDSNGNGTGPMMTLSEVAAANSGSTVIRAYLNLGMGDSYNVSPGVGTVAWVSKVTLGGVTYDFVVTPVVQVNNLQPDFAAVGAGGVWSAYYGPTDYDEAAPGTTSLYDGREAGIIKAGITADPGDGHYWDEGLFAFQPNVTIDEFAGRTLTFDVENQTGANPVWMCIEIDTGVVGDRSDNKDFQFVPATNPAGWHTVDGGAGQWQEMDDNGNGTGPMMSLSQIAAAYPGLNVVRAYLRLGMGDSYNVSPGVGTVAWVDKATLGGVTYDFVLMTNITGGVTVNYPGTDVPNVIGTNGALGSVLNISGGDVVAGSSLTVGGGGVLGMDSGSLTTTVLDNGGQFSMTGGTLNVDGAFNNATGGVFDLSGGNAVVPLQMNNEGTFTQSGGVFDPAMFTNSGTLVIIGGTNISEVFLNLAAGVVQQSGGEQDVNVATNFGSWTITGGVANLTNFVNASSGVFSDTGTYSVSPVGTFDNAGAAGMTELDVALGGAVSNSGGLTNYVLNNAGSFTMNDGSLSVTGAVVNSGSWAISGGAANLSNIFNSGSGTLTVNDGALVNVASQVNNQGVLVQSGGVLDAALWDNRGALTNSGGTNAVALFVNEGGGVVQQSGGEQDVAAAINYGVWNISGGVANLTNFVNSWGGVFSDAEAYNVTSVGSLTNMGMASIGVLNVAAGGTVYNNGLLTNQILVNAGSFTNTGAIWTNQVLVNSGNFWNTGWLIASGAITNEAGGVFVTAGSTLGGTLINNQGTFIQGGSTVNPAVFLNSGVLTNFGGLLAATLFVNQASGAATQLGGQQQAEVATNSGMWAITGGSAYLTNFVNDGSGVLTISGSSWFAGSNFVNTDSANFTINDSAFNGGYFVNAGSSTLIINGNSWFTAVNSVTVNGGSTVALNGGSLGTPLLVNAGQFSMTGGHLGAMVFTNASSGTFNQSGGTASGFLLVDNHGAFAQSNSTFEAQQFNNSGTVTISNCFNGANLFLNMGSGVLTQHSGMQQAYVATNFGAWTISGGEADLGNFVNNGSGTWTINNGMVNAGSVAVNNGSTVALNGGNVTDGLLLNAGQFGMAGGELVSSMFTNAAGGVFSFSGGTNTVGLLLNQLGGTIQQSGGEQDVNTAAANFGAWTIAGGVANLSSFVNDGSGAWTIHNGAVTAGNVTVNNGSTVALTGGAVTNGMLQNAGEFGMTGGTLSVGMFTDATGGVFRLSGGTNGVASLLNQAGGTMLQSGGEQDAAAADNLGAWIVSGGVANLTNFVNDGSGTLTVSNGAVNAASSLAVNQGSAVTLKGGSVTTMTLLNGGQFGMAGGTLNVTGAFNNAAGGVFNLGGGSAIVPLLMNNQGTFTQSGGIFDPAQFINSGALVISGGTNASALFLNQAAASVTQSGGRQDAGVATNLGAWSISGGVANLTNFVNDQGGVLTVSGGNLVANGVFDDRNGALTLNGGTVTAGQLYVTNGASSVVNLNSGTLASGGSVVNNGSLFTVGNGTDVATLRLLGGTHLFANNLFIDTNATLTGTGTITGSITDAGTIAPGTQIGTLVDNGNVTMLAGSTMAMQLAGTNSWLYDQLDVNGALTLNGTLTVSLLGYTPMVGSLFDLFDDTSLSGWFSQTNLPGLGAGLYWDTSWLYTKGDLKVKAIQGIGAGEWHSVALKSDGTVWSWGYNNCGQIGDGTMTQRLIPEQIGLTGVISVSTKDRYSVALKSDGTIWAWGYNNSGQLGDGSTTTRLSPVQVSGLNGQMTQIGVGFFHTLALRWDGTVWAWGDNNYGELGDTTTTTRLTPVQVYGLTNATAIAAGTYHSVALDNNGTVWAWGDNSYGEVGDGTTTRRTSPVQVSGLSDITAVDAGVNYSLALKDDGTVWSWGYNNHGQLGDTTTTTRVTPVQVYGLTGVVAIAAGQDHAVALKDDGTVWTWGYNNYSQLGDGTTTQRNSPVQVSGFSGGIAIAGGDMHTLAVKNDGTVWSWGGGAYGELGNGATPGRSGPVQATGLNLLGTPLMATLAATAVTSSTATLNGTVNPNGLSVGAWFQWGTTTGYGHVTSAQSAGNGNTSVAMTAPLTGLSPYGVYHYQAVATNAAGTSYGVDMVFTNSGVAPTIVTSSPLPVATAGSAYTQSLTATGGLASYTWTVVSGSLPAGLTLAGSGVISGTPTAAGTSSFRLRVTGADGLYAERNYNLQVFSFALGGWLPGAPVGGAYTETLTVAGGTGPYTWSVTGGSLPTGLTLSSGGVLSGTAMAPGTYHFTVQVTDASGVTDTLAESLTVGGGAPIPSVGAGLWHTVALKSDGTVWVWGYNNCGQLGDGTMISRVIPEQLALTSMVSVSSKDRYTLALRSDGTVWAWGYNNAGQLGDGSATMRLSPVQASGLNDMTAVAAGYFHSLALRADGAVLAWGNNNYGELGDNTTTTRATPGQVSGLTGATGVGAGAYHSVAVKSDGTVWAWGDNSYGEIGDATTIRRLLPAQVSGLSGITAVDAGVNYSLALKSDGSVWAWGYNNCGQLGDSTTTTRLSPVRVGNLTGITAIAAGADHAVALKSDGTLWAWGNNSAGELGDGTTTTRLSPVQVSGFSGLSPIAAGGSHTVALGSDHILWAWGANSYGQLGDATTINRLTPVETDPVDLLGMAWAITLPATGVSGSTATLNGSVIPNDLETTAYFQWGATTNYGSATTTQSVGSGSTNVLITAALAGLTPGAAYHYQLVATSSAGISYGADQVFNNSAAGAAPTAVQLAAASDTGVSNSDNLTNLDNSSPAMVLTFHVSGTVAGATVSLYDGASAIGSTTASGTATDVTTSGTAALADGAHSIVARQTQPGMAESDASPATVVTIDTASPTITAAVSRKVHGGAGTFDLALAFGPSSTATVEPRVGGPTTMVFTFSKNIAAAGGVLSAGNFTIANATYGSATILGDTLTLNLSGITDMATVTVALGGITDLVGNTIGGTTNLSVRALFGDVNQNGSVNVVDMQQIKNKLLGGVTAANFLYDVNCSGGMNVVDMQQVKNNLLHSASVVDGGSSGTNSGTVGQYPGTLAFTAAGYGATAMAAHMQIAVTRTGGSDTPVTVGYATSDGTAVAGVNYLTATGTLSFGVGETNKAINLILLNGALALGEGSINLSLSGPTGGATLGMQTNAVVTMAEADLTGPGMLQFSASAVTAVAGGTQAVLTVTRIGGCAGAVSVTIATTGGTAVPWTDYNPMVDTISFADGETSKTYVVPLLGNGAAAGRTIELDLLNPAGGAVLVAPSHVAITLD